MAEGEADQRTLYFRDTASETLITIQEVKVVVCKSMNSPGSPLPYPEASQV